MRGIGGMGGSLEQRPASSAAPRVLSRRRCTLSRVAAEDGGGCAGVRQSPEQSSRSGSQSDRRIIRAGVVTIQKDVIDIAGTTKTQRHKGTQRGPQMKSVNAALFVFLCVSVSCGS